jgi:hypothetical protein
MGDVRKTHPIHTCWALVVEQARSQPRDVNEDDVPGGTHR